MPERPVAQSRRYAVLPPYFPRRAASRAFTNEQTALSTSIQTMQGRDAVVFLEIGRFGGDLCCVELDLFGIFLSLDFDKARQLAVSRLPPDLSEVPRARARLRIMV
jgi:hypothetical protein